jgi:hypothetical protein
MTNEITGWINQAVAAVEQMRQWPVSILIVAALNVLGWSLKVVPYVQNRFIPLIVIASGSLLNMLLDDGVAGNRNPYLLLGLQGMLLGFAAWAVHAVLLKRLEIFLPFLNAGDAEKQTEQKPNDE